MPESIKSPPNKVKRRSSLMFFGELSIVNTVDWLTMLWMTVIVCFGLLQMGGARPETAQMMLFMNSGLLAIFGLLLLLRSFDGELEIAPALFMGVPFAAYMLSSVITAPGFSPTAMAENLLWLQAFIVFAVALHAGRERNSVIVFLSAVAIVGALSCLLSFGHYYRESTKLLPMLSLLEPGLHSPKLPEVYLGMAGGIFGEPMANFCFMTMLTGPLMILALANRFSFSIRVVIGVLALTCSLAAVLTLQARMYPILLLVWVITPLLAKANLRMMVAHYIALLAIVGTTLIVVPMIAPEFESAVQQAIAEEKVQAQTLDATALAMARENLLWGTGAGTFEWRFDQHRPEGFFWQPRDPSNDALLILVERGLAGLFLLVAPMLLTLGFATWRWIQLPWQAVRGMDTRKATRKRRSQREKQAIALSKLLPVCLGLSLSLGLLLAYTVGFIALPGMVILTAAIAGLAIRMSGWKPLQLGEATSTRFIIFGGAMASAVLIPFFLVPLYLGAIHGDEAQRLLNESRVQARQPDFNPLIFGEIDDLLERARKSNPHNLSLALLSAELEILKGHKNPRQRAQHGQQALAYLAPALRVSNPSVHLTLGQAHWLNGDIDACQNALETAARQAPNDYRYHYYLASFYNEFTHLQEQAQASFQRCNELAPEGDLNVLLLKRKIYIQ